MSFTSASRWRDVGFIAFAQFFSSLAAFLVMVTLVLALQQRGGRGIEVAALVTAEALPMVLLGRHIGRLVDRIDSRILLVIAGAVQTLSCLALTRAQSTATLVVGAVAVATGTAVAQTTRSALIPAMVVRDDLPRASAIAQTGVSVGMMLGPALAGVLVGTADVRLALVIAAASFAMTVVAGVVVRTRRGRTTAGTETPAAAVAWRLAHDRLLQATVWGATVVIAAVSAVNVVLVFFIIDTLGSTATMYGIIDSMWTAGMLAGAWALARLIRPHVSDTGIVRWLFASLAVLSGIVILVGAAPAALFLVPCYLVGGALNGGQNVMANTLIGRRAPQYALGQANTALAARVQAGGLLGFVAGGLALEVVTSPRWVVIGAGALGLLAVCVVSPLVRRAVATGSATERAESMASA